MSASPPGPVSTIPRFIPREGIQESIVLQEPVGPTPECPTRGLSDMEKKSQAQLQAMLGVPAIEHTAAIIPFPVGESTALTEAKTVEEALPLIGNMIKAERERTPGSPKRQYPRTALRHQHIVAFMLCNPFATTTEICSFFNISPTTLSTVYKSDTFQSLVAAHRVTLDSGIGGDLQAQLRDTLAAAVEVVQKAVVDRQDPDYALEVLDKAANRLGLGAKHNTGPQVQVNIVTPEMIAAARASRRHS